MSDNQSNETITGHQIDTNDSLTNDETNNEENDDITNNNINDEMIENIPSELADTPIVTKKKGRGENKIYEIFKVYKTEEEAAEDFSKANNELYHRQLIRKFTKIAYYKCRIKDCPVRWRLNIPEVHIPGVFDYTCEITSDTEHIHEDPLPMKSFGLTQKQKAFIDHFRLLYEHIKPKKIMELFFNPDLNKENIVVPSKRQIYNYIFYSSKLKHESNQIV